MELYLKTLWIIPKSYQGPIDALVKCTNNNQNGKMIVFEGDCNIIQIFDWNG